MDGIKAALKENNKVGGIKKVFLRKDLLRKVKQYDSKLSNVLQTFQVSYLFIACVTFPTHRLQAQLGLDVRFAVAQLAEGRKVRIL